MASPAQQLRSPVRRFQLLDEDGNSICGFVSTRPDWSPGSTLRLSIGEVEIVSRIAATEKARNGYDDGYLVVRPLATHTA